jgi:hypothetical protein
LHVPVIIQSSIAILILAVTDIADVMLTLHISIVTVVVLLFAPLLIGPAVVVGIFLDRIPYFHLLPRDCKLIEETELF